MFHQLLDELHEMIARLRKSYQSAVPVTEDDLQALHDKVSDVKEAAPAPKANEVPVGTNIGQGVGQADTEAGSGQAAGAQAEPNA